MSEVVNIQSGSGIHAGTNPLMRRGTAGSVHGRPPTTARSEHRMASSAHVSAHGARPAASPPRPSPPAGGIFASAARLLTLAGVRAPLLARRLAPASARALALTLVALGAVACSDDASPANSPRAPAAPGRLSLPLRSDPPKTTDPARSSNAYENQIGSMVYEPPLQYRYGSDPRELEPLLLATMPERSEDGLLYTLRLKPGIRFHDDPCFPGGRGRELVAADLAYSWLRLADQSEGLSPGWALLANSIVGLDAYHEGNGGAEAVEGREAVQDREAVQGRETVEGLKVAGRYVLELRLTEVRPHFLFVLARFQLAVVPREAVEAYGADFGRHPVGTGPYVLKTADWSDNSLDYTAHPHYHDADAGLPRVPQVRFTVFAEDTPLWLRYREQRNLDYIQVPGDFLDTAFTRRTRSLQPEFADAGHQGVADPILDFTYYGINWEDPVLGGPSESKRKLRQALSLAVDLDEINDTIYGGTVTVYDGMIPPGLEGHPKTADHRVARSLRGPDLERARRLLAEAGYPQGKGLPPLQILLGEHPKNRQQAALLARQLARIGVELRMSATPFTAVGERIRKKDAQLFAYAWHNDFPEVENNLSTFYSPNASPGVNSTNYQNAEYDRLYETVRAMSPGAERLALIETMRDLVVEDCPFIGGMARTRYYLCQPWLRNFHPSEDYYNWVKYLDLDPESYPGTRR